MNFSFHPLAVSPAERAAGDLADLLAAAPAYREFLRLAREVSADPEVTRLVGRIRDLHADYNQLAQESRAGLQAELEALPVMRDYRRAEEAANALFRAVEQVISSAAGIHFAEHARPAGCG